MKIEITNNIQSSQEGFWRDVFQRGIFVAIMRSILSTLKGADKSAKYIIATGINDAVLNKYGFNSRSTGEMIDFKKFMSICDTMSKISDALITSMQNFDKFDGTMLVNAFKSAGYKVEKGKVKLNKPNLSKTEEINAVAENIYVLGNLIALPLAIIVLVSELTGKQVPMSKLGWTAKNINLAMRKFIEVLNDFKDVAKYDKVLKTAITKDMSDEDKKVAAEKVKLLKSAITLYKEEMRNLCVFVRSIEVLCDAKENKKSTDEKPVETKEDKKETTTKEEPAKEEPKQEPKKEETK